MYEMRHQTLVFAQNLQKRGLYVVYYRARKYNWWKWKPCCSLNITQARDSQL